MHTKNLTKRECRVSFSNISETVHSPDSRFTNRCPLIRPVRQIFSNRSTSVTKIVAPPSSTVMGIII